MLYLMFVCYTRVFKSLKVELDISVLYVYYNNCDKNMIKYNNIGIYPSLFIITID